MKTKICSLCKNELSANQFCKHQREADGLCCWCKSCKSRKDKEYQEKNKEKIKIKKHESYVENSEKIKERVAKYRKENIDKVAAWDKISSNKIKEEIMLHYCNGDIKCKNCLENDIRLLTIDHIEGNGNDHRKKTKCGCGQTMCFWLKKNNFPEGFQILCWDCQWKKRHQEMQPEGELSKRQQQKKDYVEKVKKEVLSHYGGICSCGQSDPILLTLDHVNDDGADHRKIINRRGFNFYHYLRKHNYPQYPPLQVLCMKCNFRKKEGIPITIQKKCDIIET